MVLRRAAATSLLTGLRNSWRCLLDRSGERWGRRWGGQIISSGLLTAAPLPGLSAGNSGAL